MSLVDTPHGRGTVLDSNLLKSTCKVRLSNSPDAPPVCLSCSECAVLRYGKDRGDPLPPEPERPAAPPIKEVLPTPSETQRSPDRPRPQPEQVRPAPIEQEEKSEDSTGEKAQKRRRRSHRGGRGRNKSGQPHDQESTSNPAE